MASVKTKFNVGVFVSIGFCIAIAAIGWLGMSDRFEQGQYYTAYYDESVQGLDKDSPVKYRGVSIGRVEQIEVAPDGTLIEVILKIETDLQLGDDVVAQLKTVGITGLMFIELDRGSSGFTDQPPMLTFQPPYPAIATRPSEIRRFMEGIDDALTQINSLDMEGISNRVKVTLDAVNRTAEGLDLNRMSTELSQAMQRWNQTLSRLDSVLIAFQNQAEAAGTRVDRFVTDNETRLTEVLTDFKSALASANGLMSEGVYLLRNEDHRLAGLHRHLLVSLKNIEKASANLDRSLELIADQPSRLIFSEPPPARAIEFED